MEKCFSLVEVSKFLNVNYNIKISSNKLNRKLNKNKFFADKENFVLYEFYQNGKTFSSKRITYSGLIKIINMFVNTSELDIKRVLEDYSDKVIEKLKKDLRFSTVLGVLGIILSIISLSIDVLT